MTPNDQICDAAHLAFERVGKGIAYLMLVAVNLIIIVGSLNFTFHFSQN